MSRYLNSTYQYIQRSNIPTNKFQRSLPRLKIPKLEKTCERFVAALEPISGSDSRFGLTKQVIADFSHGQGKELHQMLLDYDKTVKDTSYINKFWFDMYLASRVPLPLNFNPFLSWRDAPTSQLNDQLVRATNFLVSAARFKRSLEENVLPPEVFYMNPKKTSNSSLYKNTMTMTPEAIATYVSFAFKAFPLDMSQYKNLFNSTRIPQKGMDKIEKYDPTKNRHVLVMKNGQFFKFELLDSDGQLLSPEIIYANLKHIANMPTTGDKSISISELTTNDRDFWALEREHLVNLSEKNQRNLGYIDSSMFVLCLDDLTFEPTQMIEGAHNFLHGNNPIGPTNRWFDKSFSIIITKDGHGAINFEHSWGDGVAILRFFNDTFNDAPHLLEPIDDPKAGDHLSVEHLQFDLDKRLEKSIATSRALHAKQTGNLELGKVQYGKLNRDYFKKYKLSPDAMSQLAFQIAFKKVYKHTPVTYESCSTAAFRGGRTETVRPCTNETNQAADAIIANRQNVKDQSTTRDQLKVLLQNCSKKHFQLCKEASMGDGFDRHLFSLKEMALRANKPLHKLYSDPLYLHGQKYVLSTSTLYGECFSGGGFAPVVADGFGLGYGYVDKEFGVLVSSYKDHRNNTQFVQALNETLDDITSIIEV